MSTTRAHCRNNGRESVPRFPIATRFPIGRESGNRELPFQVPDSAARDRESGSRARLGRRAGPGAFLIWSPGGSAGGVFSRCMGASAARTCGRQCAQGRWKVPTGMPASRPRRRGPSCGLGGQPHAYMEADGLLPALRGCRVRPESAGFRGSTSGLRLSFGKSPFRRGYQ